MDLFNELDRLPYFFYVLGDDYKLLGGQQTKPDKPMSFNMIYDLWEKMMSTHQNNNLNYEDKVYLAKSMKKMRIWCEGQNMAREELKDYIVKLSESQKKELEAQIKMYKDAREYHRLYVFNK
jgi:hypothetical protein